MKFVLLAIASSLVITSFASAGSLSGKISFDGKPPENRKITITKNAKVCGNGEREIVEISGNLENAIVYFEKVAGGKKKFSKKALVVQKDCRFQPSIQVMEFGKKLEVVNSDPVRHHTTAYELIGSTKLPLFNKSQPTLGYRFKEKIKTIRSSIIKLECDRHPFMHAYMLVLKNRYYAITKKNGSYKISGIPNGKYKVHIWHSKLGTVSKDITISGNSKLSYKFSL